MTNEEIEELKGLAASMGLYDDKKPCKRAVILGKAIKALEQEPCEDCVSRQMVIDAITANCIWENEYNLTSSRIKSAVEKLPSVTPKQRWIPVSERLPKLEKKVLVHVINVDNIEYDVACLKDTKHAAYDEDYHWDGKFAYGLKSVIEWKPIENEDKE